MIGGKKMQGLNNVPCAVAHSRPHYLMTYVSDVYPNILIILIQIGGVCPPDPGPF